MRTGSPDEPAGDAPPPETAETSSADPTNSDTSPSDDRSASDGADGVPAFEVVRRVLAGSGELSLADVAAEARLPVQIVREIFEATGWADRSGYDQRDVDYARSVAKMLDVYPLGAVIRGLRTRHRAITSIVVSDLGTLRDHLVVPALAAGADPVELGEQLGGAAEHTLPLVTGQLPEDYRRALLQLLDTEALARGVQLEGGRELELAVGFIDIVGYTALSGQVDPSGLDHVLSEFEDLVTKAVLDADGVLLAKFVGDAAMLVASEPISLANVLLQLVEDRTRIAEAPRRAGLNYGSVLVREGDYYGPVPNLAARLTDHAHPWSLLAAEEIGDQLADHFELERIAKTSIQGVGERRPLRVRRPGADD